MKISNRCHVETAHCSYSRIGFPAVVLKWSQQPHRVSDDPYISVKGIIEPWQWGSPVTDKYGCVSIDIESELDRFDAWVRIKFENDISVQG